MGRWSLLRTLSSAKSARQLVVDEVGRLELSDPELVDVIELLTSEVVTNAVLHGEGTVELDVTKVDRFIRVSVADEAVPLDMGPGPANLREARTVGVYCSWSPYRPHGGSKKYLRESASGSRCR